MSGGLWSIMAVMLACPSFLGESRTSDRTSAGLGAHEKPERLVLCMSSLALNTGPKDHRFFS